MHRERRREQRGGRETEIKGETEREKDTEGGAERERVSERERVCVCVEKRERESKRACLRQTDKEKE